MLRTVCCWSDRFFRLAVAVILLTVMSVPLVNAQDESSRSRVSTTPTPASDEALTPDADADSADDANEGDQADDASDAADADVADQADEAEGSADAETETDEPDDADPDETSEEAADEEISLSFENTRMAHIGRFLSENTGKSVVVHATLQNKQITIISTRKMPMNEAMQVLRGALLMEEIIIDEGPQIITLRPLNTAQFGNVPLLDVDDDLADEEDKSKIVRKVFSLDHYDPERMKEAIAPMLPDYGQVTVEGATRKLIVIDTVGNLERIAQVVANLDVQAAGQTVTQIFEVEHNDANWITSIIRTMLGGGEAAAAPPGRGPARGQNPVLALARDDGPVVLYPEMTRNWIIAVASTTTMTQVSQWVQELDQPEEQMPTTFDLHTVRFADVEELARQLQQTIASMPSGDMQESTRVVPMIQSRQLIIFGSRRGRQMVKSLLERLDVEEADNQVREVFELRHADAAKVAEQIEALFSSSYVTFQSRSHTSYGRDPQSTRVRVTHDERRNTVTVMTDARTMENIQKIIRDEWDQPLSTQDVQPKVYILEYADPVQMKEMLEGLFSRQQRSQTNPWAWLYGGMGDTDSQSVGRLFGQFGFQTMPGSNRLIVTTQNADNYAVIDAMIKELDVAQEAGLPRLIELNHAYAEDLAEQLNAILSEPGTLAEIARFERNLSRGGSDSSVTAVTNRQQQQQQSRGDAEGDRDPGIMSFWWQRARPRETEAPSSNLIGKIRVVPVNRRNALLILSPRAYVEPVTQLVKDLDQPGMQVVIHAIIAEVQHDDTSSLGVRLASDPSLFTDSRLIDQSIGGSAQVDYNDIFGGTFTVGQDTFARGLLGSTVNVNLLIQMLMRRFDMQILLEPQLYTADNQEAEFFDGLDVSIQTDSRVTDTGGIVRSFVYASIGTRLRVRPHITQNGDVDLMINLEMSRIVPGESVFGNPIFDRRETTTHVVAHDGQTIMLSGIIRQEDTSDVRKLPLLGDLPLVGGLFRSTETVRRNRELIAFITPQVIRNGAEESERAMQRYLERLKPFRDTFQLPPDLLLPEPADAPVESLPDTDEPNDEF